MPDEYTAAAILALRWFAAKGEIGWFDASAPTDAMRKRLIKRHLIEQVLPQKNLAVVKYRLSAKGRAVLVERGWL